MERKDEYSDIQEEFDDRPSSPKKTYAFGTPDHGKVAFSHLAHLTPQNREFAIQLAASTNKTDAKAAATGRVNERQSRVTSKHKSLAAPVPDPDALALEGMPETEKGVAPCIRTDCKEVVASIMEVQARNQIERDEIVQKCESMILLHQQLEEECVMMDSENKRMVQEGNILEMRVKNLDKKLKASETKKSALDQEKDELSSKLMMMELEKQRISRRTLEIQAALSDIMWKGSTNLLKDTSNKSSLYIVPSSPVTIEESDNPTMTPYTSVVDDHLIDFVERPKSVPVLPAQLRLLSSSGSFSQSRTLDSSRPLPRPQKLRSIGTPGSRKGNSSNNTVTSDLSANSRAIQTRRSFPMAKLMNRSGTVNFDERVMTPSFKGYTPSGGRRTLGTASSARLAKTLPGDSSTDFSASGSLSGTNSPFSCMQSSFSWLE